VPYRDGEVEVGFIKKTSTIKDRLSWFQTFMPLYERAAPLVEHIANPQKLKAGILPVSPGMLVESSLTLRLILDNVRKMPKLKEKELVIIQREFEMALYNCVKAAEWAEKYINRFNYGMDDKMLLNMVINTTVLAHEYMESVSKRLYPYLEQ
jgi:hypothetical protein